MSHLLGQRPLCTGYTDDGMWSLPCWTPAPAKDTHSSASLYRVGLWEPGSPTHSSSSPKHKHLCPTIKTSTPQPSPTILSLSWNLSFGFYFVNPHRWRSLVALLACHFSSSLVAGGRASNHGGECSFLCPDFSLTSGLLLSDQGLCCPCSNSAGRFSNDKGGGKLPVPWGLIPFIIQWMSLPLSAVAHSFMSCVWVLHSFMSRVWVPSESFEHPSDPVHISFQLPVGPLPSVSHHQGAYLFPCGVLNAREDVLHIVGVS